MKRSPTPLFAISIASLFVLGGCNAGDAFSEDVSAPLRAGAAGQAGAQGGEAGAGSPQAGVAGIAGIAGASGVSGEGGASGSAGGDAGAAGAATAGGSGGAGASGQSGSGSPGAGGGGSSAGAGAGAGGNTTVVACGPDYTCTYKTATSKKTGLVWQRYGESLGNWMSALTLCSDLENTSGFGGGQWRLPTAEEAETLWKEQPFAPRIDTDAFPNEAVVVMWLSDFGQLPNSHMIANLQSPQFSVKPLLDTVAGSHARCVRTP